MTNDIHVLMWDTNDVNAVLSHGIENQMYPFRKAVITALSVLVIFTGIGISGGSFNMFLV